MMKKLLLSLTILFLAQIIFAQVPYKWKFSAVKKSPTVYEIRAVADVDAPWHIYSEYMEPGGPIPTKFSFSKNPLVSFDGKIKEGGKLVKKHESVFDMDVKYFDGRAEF